MNTSTVCNSFENLQLILFLQNDKERNTIILVIPRIKNVYLIKEIK